MNQDQLDDILGRGKGDPDFHTPPWEEKTYRADPIPGRWVGEDKAQVQTTYLAENRRESDADYYQLFDEDLEDNSL